MCAITTVAEKAIMLQVHCVWVALRLSDQSKMGAPWFASQWLLQTFSQLRIAWMLSMKALVTGGFCQLCSRTVGCYHQCSSTVGCFHELPLGCGKFIHEYLAESMDVYSGTCTLNNLSTGHY